MKRILLFSFLACWPRLAFSQSYINPDTIYQSGDIILQHTDVYYKPFAPDTSDTRASLCTEADQLLDPNGVGNGTYSPVVHGTPLASWAPCTDSAGHPIAIGPYACWQRLFTARDKQDQSLPSRHSDIIAGDSVTNDTARTHGYGGVTISKNDDVDFRASGTIKLESGFHAMPGCFFHAYIEPRWDTTVFSDEFNDTVTFDNQWLKMNGTDTTNPVCYSDSNAQIVIDTDAHDGHALDVILREVLPDTALSVVTTYGLMDTCNETIVLDSEGHQVTAKRIFSTTRVRTCPFPYSSTSSPLGGPAYPHMPYGKYEIRDKIPHVLHHTNNWGGDGDLEWDINETWGGTMGVFQPDWGHQLRFGPCHGYFKRCWDWRHGDSVWAFISHDDTACASSYQPTGFPVSIIIDNIEYSVNPWVFIKDTFETADPTTLQGGFPASLLASGKTYTFYYERHNGINASTVTWSVTPDGHIFSAPYSIVGSDSNFFTKDYQPIALTLTTGRFGGKKTYSCHWIDSVNDPVNHGKLYLDDALAPTDRHSDTEAYVYTLPAAGSPGCVYPVPGVLVDRDTNGTDTAGQAAYAMEPYRYHTFTMEFLPNEVRFLYDSNVVRRFPDRTIPPGNPHYNWVSTCARGEQLIYPGELDMDGDNTYTPSNWERKFFERYDTLTGHGCWPYHGKPAAHHLIDYVKVWDVPADVKISGFPR